MAESIRGDSFLEGVLDENPKRLFDRGDEAEIGVSCEGVRL